MRKLKCVSQAWFVLQLKFIGFFHSVVLIDGSYVQNTMYVNIIRCFGYKTVNVYASMSLKVSSVSSSRVVGVVETCV
jgi:hypothetical protein